jgi:hypothetical protein
MRRSRGVKSARSFAARRPGLTAFAILLAAALIVALIQGSKPFYYDTGGYWSLAEGFNHDGSFSFSHYTYDQLRGYVLPLTFYVLHHGTLHLGIGAGTAVNVFNSLLFSILAAILVPELARIAWPDRRWGLLPRLALGALLLIFWSGYLAFPASDFPALFAGVVALIAVSRADSPLWLGLAGLAAGYAVNTRPAYLLLLPLVFVVLGWSWWKEAARMPAGAVRRVLCVAALVGGVVVVTLPQSLYNHAVTGSYGPLPGGGELAGLQYSAGLKMQRYDSIVVGPDPSLEYMEPATLSIREGLRDGRVFTTGEYLEILAHHPLTMAGNFLHHIVNGLDQRYTTPYVEHLEPPARKLLRLAGFLLVFLALFRLLWPRGRRSLGAARWRYPLTLLACCATVPTTAVETRFLAPVFILAAMTVLTPGWPNPLESAAGPRRYRTLGVAAAVLVAYLVVVGLIVHGATSHLELVPPDTPDTAFRP